MPGPFRLHLNMTKGPGDEAVQVVDFTPKMYLHAERCSRSYVAFSSKPKISEA